MIDTYDFDRFNGECADYEGKGEYIKADDIRKLMNDEKRMINEGYLLLVQNGIDCNADKYKKDAMNGLIDRILKQLPCKDVKK